jgi:hypothetical protein
MGPTAGIQLFLRVYLYVTFSHWWFWYYIGVLGTWVKKYTKRGFVIEKWEFSLVKPCSSSLFYQLIPLNQILSYLLPLSAPFFDAHYKYAYDRGLIPLSLYSTLLENGCKWAAGSVKPDSDTQICNQAMAQFEASTQSIDWDQVFVDVKDDREVGRATINGHRRVCFRTQSSIKYLAKLLKGLL